jgi:hypothetical protein
MYAKSDVDFSYVHMRIYIYIYIYIHIYIYIYICTCIHESNLLIISIYHLALLLELTSKYKCKSLYGLFYSI